MFFFFKKKTAYEMRISDWSSDVCSSDLQKLEDVISHSHEFLELISIEPVINQTGQKVGISATRTMASRTNTAAGNRRTPTDPTDSAVKDTYFCRKTD